MIWFTEQCFSNAMRLDIYIQDAERAGDGELAEFFRKAQSDSRKGRGSATSGGPPPLIIGAGWSSSTHHNAPCRTWSTGHASLSGRDEPPRPTDIQEDDQHAAAGVEPERERQYEHIKAGVLENGARTRTPRRRSRPER